MWGVWSITGFLGEGSGSKVGTGVGCLVCRRETFDRNPKKRDRSKRLCSVGRRTTASPSATFESLKGKMNGDDCVGAVCAVEVKVFGTCSCAPLSWFSLLKYRSEANSVMWGGSMVDATLSDDAAKLASTEDEGEACRTAYVNLFVDFTWKMNGART